MHWILLLGQLLAIDPLLARTIVEPQGITVAPPALSDIEIAKQQDDVVPLIKDYMDWLKFDQVWRNKCRYGWTFDLSWKPAPPWFKRDSICVGERISRPQWPQWVQTTCGDMMDKEQPWLQACSLLTQSKDGLAAELIRGEVSGLIVQAEEPKQSWFWTHLHLDGLWVMPVVSIPGPTRLFAPIGSHLAVTIADRGEIFVTPGILVVRAPTPKSEEPEWQPAIDYGVGARLMDFPLFGNQATLHFNFVYAWLQQSKLGIYLTGFSLTFKRMP